MKPNCVKYCFLLMTSLLLAYCQVPIPHREPGFPYGNNGQCRAPANLDVFIDLICPDSKQALPNVLQVADYYGPQKLRLTIHLFPLPYHRAGFYAAKGSHVISQLSNGNNSVVFSWFSAVYAEINNLATSAVHNISDADLVRLLSSIAEKVVPGSQSQFIIGVDNANIETNTRVAWKYACTRGVAATPVFFVNDIVSNDAQQTWGVTEWRKLIDPLLD